MQLQRLVSITLLALVLPGCSAFSRYVISNNSGDIVVINYSHPANFSRSGNRSICPIKPLGALPATTQDKLTSDSVAWQRLAPDKYIFNDPECSMRVAIIAGASVTFATRDPSAKKKISIASLIDADVIQLNIQHEKGNVHLNGIRRFNRLEKNGEKLYVYNFP